MADELNLETEFKALTVELKKATDEVKKQAETHATELKNLGKVSEETKENADKALTAMGTIDTRLKDIEQKMARRGGAEDEQAEDRKSLGRRFVESEEMKGAMEQKDSFRGSVRVELKNIASASTSGSSSTTGLVVSDRQGIVQLPNRPMTIRDLLMPGRTNSGFIEYPKESGFTNNAATVAENPTNPKPQSDITYTLVNTAVRTIAHFIMASRQILADAPQLESQIDGRLRYGYAYAEELQLLLGDGTGTNLLGLMPQATAYSAAGAGITESANITRIDRLRIALLQSVLALYPSTGIVLNPTDWAQIEMTKDSQGRYIFANPTGLAGPVLWGKPVVESLAMAQNQFLLGAFAMAAQIFDREDITVQMSTEDRDNFVKNMVTILAEGRLALAVYRSAALIKGNFTGAN